MGEQQSQGYRENKALTFFGLATARLYKYDLEIHNFIQKRFPRSLSVIDDTLGWLFEIVSHNAFNVIASLIGIVLAVAGVNKLVLISLGSAWMISILWIARSDMVGRLTVVSKFLVVISCALLLGFSGTSFGAWALSQYADEAKKAIKSNTAETQEYRPSPTPTSSPSPRPDSIPTPVNKPPIAKRFKVDRLFTLYRSDRSNFTGFLVESGVNEATVIDVLLAIEIVNLQYYNAEITGISTEAWTGKRWVTLERIPRGGSNRLFAVGSVGVNPAVANMSTAGTVRMDDLLGALTEVIGPRSPKRGSLFYKYKEPLFPLNIEQFRISIYEVTGEISTEVIPFNAKKFGPDDIRSTKIEFPGGIMPVDFTKWKIVGR